MDYKIKDRQFGHFNLTIKLLNNKKMNIKTKSILFSHENIIAVSKNLSVAMSDGVIKCPANATYSLSSAVIQPY